MPTQSYTPGDTIEPPETSYTLLKKWLNRKAVFLISLTILFYCTCCGFKIVYVDKVLPDNLRWYWIPFESVVFLMTIWTMMVASFSDPGFYPKAPIEEDCEENTPLFLQVPVKNLDVQMKWCTACHMYRPLRTSHCSTCDACVSHHDHHCPWVGNCIGARNYRYFIIFLLFLLLHIISISITLGFYFANILSEDNYKETIQQKVIQLGLLVLATAFVMLFALFVVGLCGFHIYLIAKGKTTHEQVSGLTRNPYDKGCISNCISTFCSVNHDSYITNSSKFFDQEQLNYCPTMELDSYNKSSRQVKMKSVTGNLKAYQYPENFSLPPNFNYDQYGENINPQKRYTNLSSYSFSSRKHQPERASRRTHKKMENLNTKEEKISASRDDIVFSAAEPVAVSKKEYDVESNLEPNPLFIDSTQTHENTTEITQNAEPSPERMTSVHVNVSSVS